MMSREAPNADTDPQVLESLLTTSGALREQADKAVTGLEGVPRTKALEHVLKKG